MMVAHIHTHTRDALVCNVARLPLACCLFPEIEIQNASDSSTGVGQFHPRKFGPIQVFIILPETCPPVTCKPSDKFTPCFVSWLFSSGVLCGLFSARITTDTLAETSAGQIRHLVANVRRFPASLHLTIALEEAAPRNIRNPVVKCTCRWMNFFKKRSDILQLSVQMLGTADSCRTELPRTT